MPKRAGGGAYSKLCEGDNAPCKSRHRKVGDVSFNTKSGSLIFKLKSSKKGNDFLRRAGEFIDESMANITEKLGPNKSERVRRFRIDQGGELGNRGALERWRTDPATRDQAARVLEQAKEKLKAYRCFTPHAKKAWMIKRKRLTASHQLSRLPPGSSEAAKLDRKQENKAEIQRAWDEFTSNGSNFQTEEEMQKRRAERYYKQTKAGKPEGYYNKKLGEYTMPSRDNSCNILVRPSGGRPTGSRRGYGSRLG